jgi:hypothetical protein
MTHFHIRWSQAMAMNWERYSSWEEAEADARAKQQAHPGETYTIEELGEGCTRCQFGNSDAPHTDSSHQ